MLDYLKLANDLDKITESIEASGLVKEAYALDKIADTLEAMSNFPPEAVSLARQLGINLTPDNAAEIVKKYFDPSMASDTVNKEAMIANPKLRSFAALAAILVSSFISNIEAKGKPISVNTPFGQKVYSAKDLKQLEKSDPKSFAIVMDSYNKQQKDNLHNMTQDSITTDDVKSLPKPGALDKVVKNVEDMSDAFGNEARLITYTDGSKELEGDILHGGVSLRDKLTRLGEIPHDPSGKRVLTERDTLTK